LLELLAQVILAVVVAVEATVLLVLMAVLEYVFFLYQQPTIQELQLVRQP
jgi:hypothetical protein